MKYCTIIVGQKFQNEEKCDKYSANWAVAVEKVVVNIGRMVLIGAENKFGHGGETRRERL